MRTFVLLTLILLSQCAYSFMTGMITEEDVRRWTGGNTPSTVPSYTTTTTTTSKTPSTAPTYSNEGLTGTNSPSTSPTTTSFPTDMPTPTAVPTPKTSPTPVPTWKYCAKEDETCKCDGTVRYGFGRAWVDKTSSGSIGCNNEVFGDPLIGVYKSCLCIQSPTKKDLEMDGVWLENHSEDGLSFAERKIQFAKLKQFRWSGAVNECAGADIWYAAPYKHSADACIKGCQEDEYCIFVTFKQGEACIYKNGQISVYGCPDCKRDGTCGNTGKCDPKTEYCSYTLTGSPKDVLTPSPTDVPTPSPTDVPTPSPTDVPTPSPTDVPTPSPTDVPTTSPTDVPTPSPTDVPTPSPTDVPAPKTYPTACTKKYTKKWPHCENIDCGVYTDFASMESACADDENCNGFSYNGVWGCLKKNCGNDGNNGMGSGTHDYYECRREAECPATHPFAQTYYSDSVPFASCCAAEPTGLNRDMCPGSWAPCASPPCRDYVAPEPVALVPASAVGEAPEKTSDRRLLSDGLREVLQKRKVKV